MCAISLLSVYSELSDLSSLNLNQTLKLSVTNIKFAWFFKYGSVGNLSQ